VFWHDPNTWYCWWKNSCTTSDVKFSFEEWDKQPYQPVIAGFLNHQQYHFESCGCLFLLLDTKVALNTWIQSAQQHLALCSKRRRSSAVSLGQWVSVQRCQWEEAKIFHFWCLGWHMFWNYPAPRIQSSPPGLWTIFSRESLWTFICDC